MVAIIFIQVGQNWNLQVEIVLRLTTEKGELRNQTKLIDSCALEMYATCAVIAVIKYELLIVDSAWHALDRDYTKSRMLHG